MRVKWLKVLVLVCLLFTQWPVTASAAGDVNKPVFESISVDKAEATVGDIVTFTIKAEDNESGLKNLGELYLKSPITGKTSYILLSYNAELDAYQGSLNITEYMEAGEWGVNWLTIYDNDGNGTTVYGPLEGSKFVVYGTNSDVEKPIFESISVDKKEAFPGETINFTIRATDQGSGLKSLGELYLKSPITGKMSYILLSYNTELDAYQGSVNITEYMEAGEWNVNWLTIYDKDGNGTTVYGPLEGSKFVVSGTNSDVEKPIFESISVDKEEALSGDTINFTIRATDKGSGLKSLGELYLKSPITGKMSYILLSYNAEIGAYKGSLPITEYMETGIWEVNWLTIYDKEGNGTTLYGPLAGGNFTLIDYTQDLTKPSFNDIRMNKTSFETSEYVHLTVDATDDTQVKSVVATYKKPITGETEEIPFSKNSDGTFGASYYLPSHAEYGEWEAASIKITDLNNNVTTVTSGLEAANFTVLKPIASLGHRYVMNNETWSYQTINGDVYVGPNAFLTINRNVTINGNVYVLGALRSYGGLRINGSLNAGNIYFGYQGYLFNGSVFLSGSNYATAMIVNNQPVSKVPMELYGTPLIKEEGRIDVEGATIPVVDVYLDYQKLNVKSDGTFRISDYYVGDRKEITFMFVDVFGNTTYKSYKVYTNDKPVVSIDKSEGIYMGTQYAELSLSKDGTIRYTVDGSEPTSNSPVYNGPIPLNESTVLKYMGEDEIGNTSEVYTKKFDLFFLDEVTNASTTVTGKGKPGLTVAFTVNEKSYSTVVNDEGTFNIDIPDLDQAKTFNVTASDLDGNASSSYEIEVKDIIAPKVSGIEQNGIYSMDKTITFNEGTATLNAVSMTSGETLKDDGNYTLLVTDDSGNKTEINFTIDKTAPVVTGVKNDGVYNKETIITFNEGNATLNGKSIVTEFVVDQEGDYSLEVIDHAGNATNVNFRVDRTSPIVTGVENNQSYSKGVVIGFDEGSATLNGVHFENNTLLETEGSYVLNVTEVSGNQTKIAFEIDLTAPKVAGVEQDGLYAKDVTLSINEGTALLNGEEFTSGTKVDEEGQHTLVVTDKAGNQTTVSFTIDKTAPIVKGVKDQAFYNQDVVILFSDGTATLNGERLESGTIVRNEGLHKLTVTDAAGNETAVSFTLDKTAPQVTGVKHDALYNSSVSPTFTEGRATLNGKSFSSGTAIKADGTYTFEIADEAGNKTVLTFTIDQTSPIYNGVNHDGMYNQNVVITFNEGTALLNGLPYVSGTEVDKEGSYKFEIKDSAGNKTAADFMIDKTAPTVSGVTDQSVMNQSVTPVFNEGTATLNAKPFASGTKVEAEGSYTLVVVDAAGNKVSKSFTIDKTAPRIVGAADKGIYNKDIAISFNEGIAMLNGSPFSNGTIVKAEGIYTLEVSDNAGNKALIKFTVDKTAPKVSGAVNGGLSNKDVTLAFNEGSATLNGLPFKSGTIVKAAGVYTLVVADTAGNKTVLKFTIDKTAPGVPTVNAVSDQSTVVSGKAEARATVKLYISGRFVKSMAADGYGNYKFGIVKQKAGVEVKVTATDKAGNVSGSKAVKVIDKTPPAIPTVNKVTYKTIYVTGKTEKGSTVYVYRGSVLLGKATADSTGSFKVKISAQKKGTTLSVFAKDTAGNQSGKRVVSVY